jgi:transcriptional regulator with XRE-family HTH domain
MEARLQATGLDLRRLASLMQVSKVSVRAWTRGRTVPPADRRAMLARVLGVAVEELWPVVDGGRP